MKEELAAQDIRVTFSPDQNTHESITEEIPRKISDIYTPDFLPEEEKESVLEETPIEIIEETDSVSDFKSSSLLRLRNLYQENIKSSVPKNDTSHSSSIKAKASLPALPKLTIPIAPILKKIKNCCGYSFLTYSSSSHKKDSPLCYSWCYCNK